MRYTVRCKDGFYTSDAKGSVSIVGVDKARLCYTRTSAESFAKKLNNMKFVTEIEAYFLFSEKMIGNVIKLLDYYCGDPANEKEVIDLSTQLSSQLKECVNAQIGPKDSVTCSSCHTIAEKLFTSPEGEKLCIKCLAVRIGM